MKFRDEFDFLSNMYPCKVHDSYGIEYSCVESAFQAQKTDELSERRKFSRMTGPVAKKAGRRLNLVSNWDEERVNVMRDLLMEKFSDPELMAKLIAVEGDIVEENTWNDKFWGVYKGKGENMLGKLLMEVREIASMPSPPTKEEREYHMVPGSIVITSISGLKTAMENMSIDDAWFVVRSLKSLGGSVPDLKTVHSCWVNQLSPSPGLFKMYCDLKSQGAWNHDAFMRLYVPQFLEEMKTDFSRKHLNALYSNVIKGGKTIALVCFCKDETECHRSILAGLMQGVGVKVYNEMGKEVDYKLYYDMYKGVTQPTAVVPPPQSVAEPVSQPESVVQPVATPDPQPVAELVVEPQQNVNPEPVQDVDIVPQQQAEQVEQPQVTAKLEFYLLVAGSRTFHDAVTMEGVLNHMLSAKVLTHKIVIVEGGARGADTLAREYAINHGYEYKEFPAQWIVNGQKDKAAGFKRNRQMHEFLSQQANRGCVCFWDGKSRGTADNFKLCKEFNTPLRVFDFELFQYLDNV